MENTKKEIMEQFNKTLNDLTNIVSALEFTTDAMEGNKDDCKVIDRPEIGSIRVATEMFNSVLGTQLELFYSINTAKWESEVQA